MQPIIANQTFNAILQLVIAVGLFASVMAPLTVKWNWLHSLLTIFAGLGTDARKVATGAAMMMKGTSKAPAKIATLALFLLAFVGCSNVTPKTVQTDVVSGLSFEQLACVLAQEELGASEPRVIAEACSITGDLLKVIESVNLASKQAHALAMVAKAKAATK